MNQYFFLFRGGDARLASESAEYQQAHMQKWMQWMGALGEKGQLVGAEPLHPTGKQVSGTKKTVTDGPYMEGKEMVGGYLMCKAESYDAAVEVAKGCPILDFEDGVVEIREIQVINM